MGCNLSIATNPRSGPTTSLQPYLFPSQETQREKLRKKQKQRKPPTALRAGDSGGCDAHPHALCANTWTRAPQEPNAPGICNFYSFALLGAEQGAERMRLGLRVHFSACTSCAKHQRSKFPFCIGKVTYFCFLIIFCMLDPGSPQ